MQKEKSTVSKMASELKGSEIIRLAAEIRQRKKRGELILNYTIGDFDPVIFSVPSLLKYEICTALHENETNYPPADGVPELKNSVLELISTRLNCTYTSEELMIAGGARPLIYAAYRTLLDPSDKVIVPVPSWNNNHYCHLCGAEPLFVQTTPENCFMPQASEIENLLPQATMLALCSPLNPAGTVFKPEELKKICFSVLKENKKREADGKKPLYILFDQVYWMLTFGKTVHCHPVEQAPEIKNCTIYIDGISKSLAATGLRIGWAHGPEHIISRMKSILGHIGAWAPKAEQVGLARFLQDKDSLDSYLCDFKKALNKKLQAFHKGFLKLKKEKFPVDSIAPQGAIYLTVKINLPGNIADALLSKGIALVPFSAFGDQKNTCWFRLSAGTVFEDEIPVFFKKLKSLF